MAWITRSQPRRGALMSTLRHRFGAVGTVGGPRRRLAACGSDSRHSATPVAVFDVGADPARNIPAADPRHPVVLTAAQVHSTFDSLLSTHVALVAALMHDVGAGEADTRKPVDGADGEHAVAHRCDRGPVRNSGGAGVRAAVGAAHPVLRRLRAGDPRPRRQRRRTRPRTVCATTRTTSPASSRPPPPVVSPSWRSRTCSTVTSRI